MAAAKLGVNLNILWEGYIRAYGVDRLGSYGDEPIGSGWDYCAAQDYP